MLLNIYAEVFNQKCILKCKNISITLQMPVLCRESRGMPVPRGNRAWAGPVSGSVPGRRTVLHCPLPASQRSRIRLLRHGRFLCQLLPKMWTSMIVFWHIWAFYLPSAWPRCPSRWASFCAAPGVRAVHWPSGVLRLLQKHLLHVYWWKQDYRSFCCMGYTSTCSLLHLFTFFFFCFLSGTDYVCVCRRGVPGWRTVLVTTVWKQQWEQWYLLLGLFVHLLMTQSVFRFGPLKMNANNELRV